MSLDDLRLFLQVARCRSMSEAALSLGLSVPTIARRLDSLEASIGLRLLVRTPRGLTLTDHGVQLVSRAAGLQGEIAEIDRLLASLRDGPREVVLRVSATEPVIAEILAPRLSDLLTQKAAPIVELRVDNDLAAIAMHDADIAVRLVRPETDSLMTRRIATLEFALYGAPAEVAALDGGDTKSMPILAYDDRYGPIAERRWIDQAGLARRVVARMSSTRGLLAAVAAGTGFALLPAILARRIGLQPVPIATMPAPASREVWLIWHRDLSRVASARSVLDWIARAFAHAMNEADGAASLTPAART